jgi:hypothetical protein
LFIKFALFTHILSDVLCFLHIWLFLYCVDDTLPYVMFL